MLLLLLLLLVFAGIYYLVSVKKKVELSSSIMLFILSLATSAILSKPLFDSFDVIGAMPSLKGVLSLVIFFILFVVCSLGFFVETVFSLITMIKMIGSKLVSAQKLLRKTLFLVLSLSVITLLLLVISLFWEPKFSGFSMGTMAKMLFVDGIEVVYFLIICTSLLIIQSIIGLFSQNKEHLFPATISILFSALIIIFISIKSIASLIGGNNIWECVFYLFLMLLITYWFIQKIFNLPKTKFQLSIEKICICTKMFLHEKVFPETKIILCKMKLILFSPQKVWTSIDNENNSHEKVLTSFVLPLTAFVAVVAFIGYGLIGYKTETYYSSWASYSNYHSLVSVGFKIAFAMAITIVAGIYLISFVINALAKKFSSQTNLNKAFSLVAYSYTPAFVGGIFFIFPNYAWFAIITSVYSLFLFYSGLQILMQTPLEKKNNYFLVAAVSMAVIYMGTTALWIHFFNNALCPGF
jgi:hypothetical protein